MASSSSSRNWVYDVFPSFSGEDIRKNFLSHFLKELDRKLIISFKDSEIERSHSIGPELVHAIRNSRVAVVVFSKNYASSSWCLNELLEIVKCKEDFGQKVIPVFHGLDPSHVRKQTGYFGQIFEKTCHNITDEVKIRWEGALTDVANILGYHSATWGNEATLIEAIANDVLGKLLLTPSKDFENFVGIEDHIAQMSALLSLESEEVRMVGVWGSSGIGKTTIARVLFNRLSRHFQGSIYIDRHFISNSIGNDSKGNLYDYNVKLHLQERFLSKILDKQGVEVNHLGAVRDKLKDMKVVIFIDDLDDQLVLDTLVGGKEWFGRGSRIIAITKDKQFLRGHGIKCIYKVNIPSKEVALQMFCRSAFTRNSPPDGFMELASEVAVRVGGLPLGLNLVGSSMRGRDKTYWVNKLPTLRKGLDGDIKEALRVSYDGLEREEYKALFRHIACYFNGDETDYIKLMLADFQLNFDIGIQFLADKSLIQLWPSTTDKKFVDMHCLLEELGKEFVHAQSTKLGKREYLTDPDNVLDVLKYGTGTESLLGITLDMDELPLDMDKPRELHIHENAFKNMRNLRFLNFYTTERDKKKLIWNLAEYCFNNFPSKVRFLRWDGYPVRHLPSNFCPQNLVELQMPGSKLVKLWDGVQPLTGLRKMNLSGSENLREIPDLSMAINLEKVNLKHCLSLMELPPSIQYLIKLETLRMDNCESLETLPTGINLPWLFKLTLNGCSRLKSFPDISANIGILYLEGTAIEEFPTNLRLEYICDLDIDLKYTKWKIEQPLSHLLTMLSSSLEFLKLSNMPSLVELPSYIQHFNKLEHLSITNCINLETLPAGINLESLTVLDFSGCSRLSSFPNISTNIETLTLCETAIEEVPWWIKDFSNLDYLDMQGCKGLQRVSLNTHRLFCLEFVNFSNCLKLTEVSLNGTYYENSYYPQRPNVSVMFINCLHLDQEALLQQPPVFFKSLLLPGEEVPSCFTHRTTGTSFTNIPLLRDSPLYQLHFGFRACVVPDFKSVLINNGVLDIRVCCRFIDRLGNHFDSAVWNEKYFVGVEDRVNHLVIFDGNFFPEKEKTFPRPKVNYDHVRVDIQFHIINVESGYKLRGCGLRFKGGDVSNHEEDEGEEARRKSKRVRRE